MKGKTDLIKLGIRTMLSDIDGFDSLVRVINVVDLMKLEPNTEHPHGLSDHEFDALFTKDKPIVFAFHGYPWLVHRLTYRRTNHENIVLRHDCFKRSGQVPPGAGCDKQAPLVG